jgi:DnaJ-class molecular chaperone
MPRAVEVTNACLYSQKPELPEMDSEEMELLSSFMADTSNLERKLQVERIIKHKLNPFEVLQIKPVNTAEETNLAYRKISLMVHPDKCKHPMAEEAFEVCKKSLAELQDEEKRPFYLECWEASRLEGERELKKLRKQEKEDAAKNKKATVEEVANLRNAFLGGAVRIHLLVSFAPMNSTPGRPRCRLLTASDLGMQVRQRKRNREGKKKDVDKETDDQESFKASCPQKDAQNS